MEQSLGVKELKEALVAVNELAIFLAERMKDGAGVDDAMALYSKLASDEAFKAKMMAAYDGIAMVPAEIKDITLPEGIELAMLQVQYVPGLLAALKKA